MNTKKEYIQNAIDSLGKAVGKITEAEAWLARLPPCRETDKAIAEANQSTLRALALVDGNANESK